uniref:Protein sleepless n=1 Tax=Bactrocera dorsalis TaxID=27457 RepID=A0A034WRQ5_BACDO
MNRVLIFPIVCLIACSFINLTTSLDCYICDSTSGQNCNDKQSATCDPELAQQTVNYMRKYLYVNETILNTTSSTYSCVVEDILRNKGVMQFYYGCSYSIIDLCSFMAVGFSQYQVCYKCNTNDCNTNFNNSYFNNNGNYSSTYSFTLTASIILALIAKLFCY